MRLTSVELAIQEILRLHADLPTVEKRLEGICKFVQRTMSDLLGTHQNALASIKDEEVVAKAVELVLRRLPREHQHEPAPTMKYLRDTAVSKVMGVSVGALRKWRSERSPKSPPYITAQISQRPRPSSPFVARSPTSDAFEGFAPFSFSFRKREF